MANGIVGVAIGALVGASVATGAFFAASAVAGPPIRVTQAKVPLKRIVLPPPVIAGPSITVTCPDNGPMLSTYENGWWATADIGAYMGPLAFWSYPDPTNVANTLTNVGCPYHDVDTTKPNFYQLNTTLPPNVTSCVANQTTKSVTCSLPTK